MSFRSPLGEQRYAALTRVASRSVIGLDFDGTLAPIVDDPARAYILPDAHEVLVELADHVAAIAVITGRPARQALDLGGLEAVADAAQAAGAELFVFGQYGNERWSSRRRRIMGARPPRGLAGFERDLPQVLHQAGAAEAHVEDKGLAIAVHTRRMPDADEAFDRLLAPLQELAARHGLALEPGRSVLEVRSPGSHKGMVVRRLAAVMDAEGFLFAGDDLGDLQAFEALGELDEQGLATLRVCSASGEENALVGEADVVVRGPAGVLGLLRRLTADSQDPA